MPAPTAAPADDADDFSFLGDKPLPGGDFVTRRELAERLAQFLDDEIQELSMLLGKKKMRRKELHRTFGTKSPTE